MIRLRRAVHERPELSNEEVETTSTVRRELAAAGIRHVDRLDPTGLVVDIRGTAPGRVVAVRGDLDALPLDEETGLSYASKVPGVMHACGHDVHTAMAFGVAVTAHQRRHELRGTLRVIFQPAEEAEPLGGRAVVEAGILRDVDAVIALHVTPELDTGTLGLRAGPVMASSDEFTVTITGSSSHTGWPHLGNDALLAGAAVVQAVQEIVSRRTAPLSALVVNVGVFDAGTAPNIVADRAVLRGTIRSLTEAARDGAHQFLREITEATCRTRRCDATVTITRGEPVLRNAPHVVDAFERAARPPDVVHLEQPTMNSEDFAFYAEQVPAAMAWLGVRNASERLTYPLHHPRFAVDEAAIPIGAAALFDTASYLMHTDA